MPYCLDNSLPSGLGKVVGKNGLVYEDAAAAMSSYRSRSHNTRDYRQKILWSYSFEIHRIFLWDRIHDKDYCPLNHDNSFQSLLQIEKQTFIDHSLEHFDHHLFVSVLKK